MNKSLRILFFVSVTDILGFGVLIPLIPYMADRLGASPSVVTWILGSYSLCQLIAAPFWGRLSDRFGRRPILISSLAGACVSYIILGFAGSILWLLISRMLAGFMAGNLAAAFAYASDVSTPQERAKSHGILGAAIGVGFMLGPAIGGLIAGENEATANFVAPAILSAALSVIAMLLVYFVLPESHTAEQRAAHRGHPRSHPLQLLRRRPALLCLTSSTLLVTSATGILESIFAIWALNRFGYGPRTVGVAMFGLALVAVLMQGGVVRSVVPRIGEARLARFGVLTYVVGLALLGDPGANLAMVIVALVLCGAGSGLYSPCASALASKEALHGDRGSVMGTYQAGGSLARVIGPAISGPVYTLLGTTAPFLLGACIMLPAAWLIGRARRRRALSPLESA